MNFKNFLVINGYFYLGVGIAFALYGPLMIDFFGILEVPGGGGETYWFAASFARLLGAALFGFGLVLLALRRPLESHLPTPQRRQIILALLLGHLVALYVAVTQQVTIWLKPIGWATTGIYLFLAGMYLFFLLTSAEKSNSSA